MLKTMRILSSAEVILTALHGLWTGTDTYHLLMLAFLGLLQLFTGLEEFQKGKKIAGWFGIAVFLIIAIVLIEIYRMA